jgi:hypothetical protein
VIGDDTQAGRGQVRGTVSRAAARIRSWNRSIS